jgi:hypothetical protein
MTIVEKIKVIDEYLHKNSLSPISEILSEYREILVKTNENIDKVSIDIGYEELYCQMGVGGCSLPTAITVYENRWTTNELIEKTISQLREDKLIEIRDFEECVVSSYCEGEYDTKLKLKDLAEILKIQFKKPNKILGSNLVKYEFGIPQYREDDYDFDLEDWKK